MTVGIVVRFVFGGTGMSTAWEALGCTVAWTVWAGIAAVEVPATVQPNPSQLVAIALPPNYNTSTLPYVVSQDPNLILISLSYGYNANGTQNLTVNLGDPFPNEAVTGNVRVDW